MKCDPATRPPTPPDHPDSIRLDWLMEEILTHVGSSRILRNIGIDEEDLTGPGDADMSQLSRYAIDRAIERKANAEKKKKEF